MSDRNWRLKIYKRRKWGTEKTKMQTGEGVKGKNDNNSQDLFNSGTKIIKM